jgi:hypothetical protein
VTEDIVIPDHPPMAVREVRYPGEAVACVVATDRYLAADALDAIDVDYEPLPPVLDMAEALTEASPKVHESGNRAFTWTFAQGDIDAAFRDAPVLIDRTYVQQRLIPTAMEPRAVVATTDGESFTLWSSTQIPHGHRRVVGDDDVLGHRPRARQAALLVGDVLTAEDGDHARHVSRGGDVDAHDARMGHGAALEGDVQQPGKLDVVGPGGAPGQQPGVLLAPARPADLAGAVGFGQLPALGDLLGDHARVELFGHGVVTACPMLWAPRRTALTMLQ